MPIYEYVCTECRSEFELLRPMGKSDDVASCPQGHPRGQRMISLVASPSYRGGAEEMSR